jgi:hypothetical protein
MTTLFIIELTINMPRRRLGTGSCNLYFEDMPVDINETALQAVDSAKKYRHGSSQPDHETLRHWASQEASLNIFHCSSVSGEDFTFIKQVITTYMDGFPDFLKKASEDISSHRLPTRHLLKSTVGRPEFTRRSSLIILLSSETIIFVRLEIQELIYYISFKRRNWKLQMRGFQPLDVFSFISFSNFEEVYRDEDHCDKLKPSNISQKSFFMEKIMTGFIFFHWPAAG